mgnify:CR=1 FL=1
MLLDQGAAEGFDLVIGVGFIFGKVIESVTRQPEMRDEITSIQWLGFALTEAIVFYAFIFGLIAFFL